MVGLKQRKDKRITGFTGNTLQVLFQRCFVVLLISIPMLISGCVTQPISTSLDSRSFEVLPEKYRKIALKYEKKGQIPEALESWRVVQELKPDDLAVEQKIENLQRKSSERAEKHFNKGVAYFQKSQLSRARREFLLTLAYDQNHKKALNYLKIEMQQPVFKTYTVQPGDTLRKIADREWHDPNNIAFIEAFNDVDPAKTLYSGTKLKLLLLDKDFHGKKKPVQTMVQVIPQEKIPEVVESTGGEDQYDQYKEIYQEAKAFLHKKDYYKSLQLLYTIDRNYRDVHSLITSAESSLEQQVDAHYQKGMGYFFSEDLGRAIAEWEEVLRLKPGHLKAKKDLQDAKRMQQRLNEY